MKFGIHLPQWGPDATRDGVLLVARTAEATGLDSVWVADHLVFPTRSESTYPYRSGGRPFEAQDGFLEAFTVLALVAGAIERIALGTSVLVMPMRHPLHVAKTAATLDVLSGGRAVLAVGAGWWKEEFAALGAHFRRRGKRFDEQIDIVRALWSHGAMEHHGEFYDFDEVVCEPRPIQPGGPPLWIGGMGLPGWRRAAQRGDAWHAVGSHADTLAEGRVQVNRLAREAARDPDEIAFSTSAGLPPNPDEAVERMVRLGRLGVGHVVMNVGGSSVRAICHAIERFADEALPVIRRELSSTQVRAEIANELGADEARGGLSILRQFRPV